MVDSMGRRRLLDHVARPAGSLDGCARGGAERVRVDRQGLGDLALGEDLHRDALAGAQPLVAQRLEGHVGALVEARLEILEVDRLRVRADGHLPALEARAVLGARARAVALLAAPGGLAHARALTAADALARLAAAGGGLQRVQSEITHRSSPGVARDAPCRAIAGCP